MTGGIVSFGPPLGGVVVLAHECENIIVHKMIRTGIPGTSIFSIPREQCRVRAADIRQQCSLIFSLKEQIENESAALKLLMK